MPMPTSFSTSSFSGPQSLVKVAASASNALQPTAAPTAHFSDAVRTLFSADAPAPDVFLASTALKVAECESQMTQVCRQNRLQLETNLYEMLDARDAISGHSHGLEEATSTASQIQLLVSEKAALLEERMQTRMNLDSALVLVSQTRKFIRTYARIEDIIAARRLHTALKMLNRVDDEVNALYSTVDASKSREILAQLYPRARRLRDDIRMHARRILFTHLSALDAAARNVGRFALSRIHATMAANAAPDGATVAVGATAPPWTPYVSSDGPQLAPVRAMSERRGRVTRTRSDLEQPASLKGTSGRIKHVEVPRLYLRPLLQCVQVYGDLGLFPDLCIEYRRERENQLKALLSRHEPERTLSSLEKTLETLAGFFVVERAVGMCVGIELLDDAVVVKEFWRMGYARIVAAVEWLANSTGAVPSSLALTNVRVSLDNFAETYGFPV